MGKNFIYCLLAGAALKSGAKTVTFITFVRLSVIAPAGILPKVQK
jgi:hypothetical protein